MTYKFSYTNHPDLLAHAIATGTLRHSKWSASPGRYGNYLWAHIFGTKGEYAAASMLGAIVLNDDSQCDLSLGSHRIEIKSFSYDTWKALGPVVSQKQLESIQKKADIIIWVVGSKTEFEIVGWTNVVDIDPSETVDTVVGSSIVKNIEIPANILFSADTLERRLEIM